MISVIAVGIPATRVSALQDIPCATHDSNKVYSTLQDVLESDFSHFNSVCLTGITATEFRALISAARGSYSEEDLLFIYFSGHGLVEFDRLFLCFSDADDDQKGRGRISSNELGQMLWYFKCRIILVLDCCHSGVALNLTHKEGIWDNPKISVIASALPYSTSQFDTDGSVFTKTFCNVLVNLYHSEQKILLVKVVENICQLGQQCLLNVQEGIPDIVLRQKNAIPMQQERFFISNFIHKIQQVDYDTREMLWYSLAELPTVTQLQVIRDYIKDPHYIGDSSWLVRRALGSVISGMRGMDNLRVELVNELMSSLDWMSKCIGLIGARYLVDQSDVMEKMKTILTNPNLPMDAVWLANLYLSDSESYDIELGLGSALSQTSWGLVDLWRRSSQSSQDNDNLLGLFKSKVKNTELLNQLYTHLRLQYNDQPEYQEFENEVTRSKLMIELYKHPKRNRLGKERLKSKWLVSLLYGNWRDHLNFDLREFVNYFPHDYMINEFKVLSGSPSVETKMAIFQYMSADQEIFKEFNEGLTWGLVDKHPWVRRTAIQAYRDFPDLLQKAYLDNFDQRLFPGVMDFILVAGTLSCIGLEEYIEKYKFSPFELKSLRWDLASLH